MSGIARSRSRRLAVVIAVVIVVSAAILVFDGGRPLYELITYERESFPEYGGGRLDVLRNRWDLWGDHEIWRVSTRSGHRLIDVRRATSRDGGIGTKVLADGVVEINSNGVRRMRIVFHGPDAASVVRTRG